MRNLFYCLMMLMSLSMSLSLPAVAFAAEETPAKSPEEYARELEESLMSGDPSALSPEMRDLYETLKRNSASGLVLNYNATEADKADDDTPDDPSADGVGFGIDMGSLTLDGQQKLACEALLCLSSGERPSECMPSLNAYFGIHYKKKPGKTARKRQEFLNLCPR